MNRTYLERHGSDKNMHRFYQVHIAPGLFDEGSFIWEWRGRIRSPRTVHKDWFETEEEAATPSQNIIDSKQNKGYQPLVLVPLVPERKL